MSQVLGGALILTIGLTSQPAQAAPQKGADTLASAFNRAAAHSDVPRDLLAALGYAETRLDGHDGEPSASGGYGVMHLTSNPKVRTLDEAVTRTRLDRTELRTKDAANVAGAASVLRSYADAAGLTAAQRRDVNQWYGVIARYGGSANPTTARFYADAVYDLLASGFHAATATGPVTVAARPVAPERGQYADVAPLGATADIGIQSTDYGPAAWVPAHTNNYTVSSRESSYPINYIVIHTAQGSYSGTLSWFQNASAGVSAHYTIRSSDGAVGQSVRDKDIAYHAGNWTYNTQSIGIEHEGYVNNASWYTDAMYRSSAALVRHLSNKYGIPKTRSNIIGHNQVPGATHTDPGPNWNWTYYMQLITGTTTPPPTWSTIVDNTTAGRFTASANWGTSSYSTQRYGADYRFANPVAASDVAWYKVNIPATATYRVEVWYPAVAGYNTTTPYIVATSGGNQTVYVNQAATGGQWRSLGNFSLAAGDANKVGVSRWSGSTGYVVADAIRITRV